MLPDKLIWEYTGSQIYALYNIILKREVAEKNELVKIIQAGLSGVKDDFITIKKENDNIKEPKNLGEIGMQSDAYYKNYNPDLAVKKEEGG